MRVKKNPRKIVVKADEDIQPFVPPQVYYPISREELIELYYEKRLSLREIAKITGRGETTIRRWMDKYKLPRRNYSEATILHHIKQKEEQDGEDNREVS